MEICKYKGTYKQEIIELLRLNTPKYFSPDEEGDFIYYLDNHAENYFLCILDRKIVGCGGYNLTEDGETAKISWDIIHPDFQGMGIGSKLTKYRIEEMKKIAGVATISVRTSQLVYQFYEKFGLEIREIVKDYWAEGFDLYRLDCDKNLVII